MEWREPLSHSLPAPRDDEPASLRQDIVDELADHLQCSLDRQRLNGADPHAARAEALRRFGDPWAIARKLWFDALKEQIMSQRLMLGLAVVMTLACLASTGIAWQAIRTGNVAVAQMVEANRAAADAARVAHESTREANAALMTKLEKLTASPPAPASLEWNDVKVRLVAEDRKTPLPEGFRAVLTGNILEAAKSTSVTGRLDKLGLAEFGLIRTGQHILQVTTPFGDAFERHIDVHPGKPVLVEVVCPAAPPGEAEIRATVEWPDDLKDKEYWLVAGFFPLPRMSDSTGNWSISSPAGDEQVLVVEPSGQLRNFKSSMPRVSRSSFAFRRGNFGGMSSRYFDLRGGRGGADGFGFQQSGSPPNTIGLHTIGQSFDSSNRHYAFGLPEIEPKPTMKWQAVRYSMNALLVTVRGTGANAESANDLTVVAGALQSAFDDRGQGSRSIVTLSGERIPTYDAVAGEPNEWTIKLPEDVVKILREQSP